MAITIHNIVEEGEPGTAREATSSAARQSPPARRAPPRYQSASIVSVYLPEEVVQAIDALRGQDGRTRSELIAGILKTHVRGLPVCRDAAQPPIGAIPGRRSRFP